MADLNVSLVLQGVDNQASVTVNNVAKAVDGLGKAADQASNPLHHLAELFATGLGVGAAVGGLNDLLHVFGGIKGAAVDLTATLEQTQVAFANLFESPTKAEAMIGALKDLAASSHLMTTTLTDGTRQLAAMGVQTEQLLPLIKDIGTLSAASGEDASAAFKRISLAVGELNNTGQAYTRQLNQLAFAGVPIYKALADSIGVTTGQLHEMLKAGEVSSAQVIDVLHQLANSPKYGDLMEQQSQTARGALTTIKDNIAFLISDGFNPFFKLLEQGEVAFANFTRTEEWKTWAALLATGAQNAAEALKGLLGGLQPLADGFAAMWKTLNTSGNVSEAFAQLKDGIAATLQGGLDAVTAFARQFFGAGFDLVSQLAQGMTSAASDVVQGAVNVVAETIAGFLIGHSPPPDGPLSQIDAGGRQLMETYGRGMADGLGPAHAAIGQVADDFKAAGSNIAALKQVGFEATDAIKGIAGQMHEVEHASAALKDQMRDVKDGYDAQLKPLQDQLHTLERQRDVVDELQGLDLKREDIALRQAERAAQGDPAQRAALTGNLATLQQEASRQRLADQLAANADELAGLSPFALSASRQSRNAALAEQGTRLDEREAGLLYGATNTGADELAKLGERLTRLQAPADTTNVAHLQSQLAAVGQPATGATAQLAALREQQQRERLQTTLSAPQGKTETAAAYKERQDNARMSLQEIDLQKRAQQEADAAKRKALQEQIAAAQKTDADKEKARQQEIADTQRQIAAVQQRAQLEEQRRQKELADIERQRDLLKARAAADAEADAKADKRAGARMTELENQQKILETQQAIAALADPNTQGALQVQRDALTARQEENRLALDTFNLDKQRAELPLKDAIADIKDAETEALDPLKAQLEQLQRQHEALSAQRQEWQAIKADIAEAAQKASAAAAAAKAAAKESAHGDNALNIPKIDVEAIATEQKERIAAAAATLGQNLATGMGDWLREHAGALVIGALGTALGAGVGGALLGGGAGSLIGGALGSLLGPIGTVVGAALGGVIATGLGAVIGGLLGTEIGHAVDGLLHGQGTDFLTKLGDVWHDLTTKLGELNAVAGQLGIWDDLRDIWDTLKGIGADLWQAVKDIASVFDDGKGNADAFNFILGALALTFKGIVTVVKDVLAAYKTFLDVSKDVRDFLGTALHDATQTAIDILVTLGKTASDIGDAFDQFGTGLHATWDDIVEVVTHAGDRLGTAIHEAWETAKTTVGDALKALGADIQKWWGATIPEDIRTDLEQIGTNLTERWEGFKTTVGDKLDAIGTAIHDKWQTATEWIGTKLGDMKTAIEEKWTGFKQFVGDRAEDMRKGLEEKWTAITGAAATAWEQVKTTIADWLSGPKGALQAVISWAADVLGKLGTLGTDALTKAGEIGKNVVDGITTGITGAWKGFTDFLGDRVRDLIKTVKDILGIQSPSSVFQEIGTSVMDGLQKGLTDAFEGVKAWLGTMASQLGSSVQGALQSARSALPGGGGSNTASAPGGTQGGTATATTGSGAIGVPAGFADTDISEYIVQAARGRGIDETIALRVAMSEGGVTEYAKLADFTGPPNYSGKSWWPFQLHYGGKDTPYAAWGGSAGQGNLFTAATGIQPGDPSGWRASIDWALDVAKRSGWGQWYGARDQGITGFMGISHDSGGWIMEPTIGVDQRGRVHGFALNGVPEQIVPASAGGRRGGDTYITVTGIGLDEVAAEIERRQRHQRILYGGT